MSAAELRERLASVLGETGNRARAARERWNASSAEDLRVRIGGAALGGLLLGRVVRRVGR